MISVLLYIYAGLLYLTAMGFVVVLPLTVLISSSVISYHRKTTLRKGYP